MRLGLLYALAISGAIVSACSKSGYVREEFGDEVALRSNQNPSLDVLPDVVFYEHTGDRTYGVRRLNGDEATRNGFWAKCLLFEGSKTRVRYYGPSLASAPKAFKSKVAIKFAKRKCLNFGAKTDRNRRGNFIDDYLRGP